MIFVVGIHFAGLTRSSKFVLSATSFVPFIANIGLFFPCLRTKTSTNGFTGLGGGQSRDEAPRLETPSSSPPRVAFPGEAG